MATGEWVAGDFAKVLGVAATLTLPSPSRARVRLAPPTAGISERLGCGDVVRHGSSKRLTASLVGADCPEEAGQRRGPYRRRLGTPG